MIRAADRVRAELSGYPKSKRERQLFVIFQAAIDDSGNQPDQELFVLAGFVAPADGWIAFADEWEAVLNKPPKVEYFKFSQALWLKGQFDRKKGWTEEMRDQRLEELVRVIVKYAPARFYSAMRHDHYAKYLRDSAPAVVRTLLTDQPYILLAGRTVSSALSVMMATQLQGECQFFYDTQPGQDVILTAVWPQIIASVEETPVDLPDGYSLPKLKAPPTFRDERDWLPLQAADLLAGALRQELLVGSSPASLKQLEDIPSVGIPFSEEQVMQMGVDIVEMMDKFQAENPNIPVQHFDSASAHRLRKRNMRNMKGANPKTRRG